MSAATHSEANAFKLALGTAQLGAAYGVTNRCGRPDDAAAEALIEAALECGVTMFDTAPGYGDAEVRLGRLLRGRNVRIVTKVPAMAGEPRPEEALRTSLNGSLESLDRDQIYGVLLHDATSLYHRGASRVAEALHAARDEGLVERIGVSLYNPSDAKFALQLVQPDIVQLPFNVLDQRMQKTEMLRRLADSGVEIYARSVFLQGLLLQRSGKLPNWFSAAASTLNAFSTVAAQAGLSPMEACLDCVMRRPEFTHVVVGAANAMEFREIAKAANSMCSAINYDAFAINDPELLEPHRWPMMDSRDGIYLSNS